MALVNLVYVSRNNLQTDDEAFAGPVNQILEEAIAWNAPRYVTGALLFDQNHFIQVLEGESDAVWETYKRIEKDARHSDVQIVGFDECNERQFGSWWMRCAGKTDQNSGIFDAYAVDGVFNPRRLTKPQILSLMNDLSRPLSTAAETGFCDDRLVQTKRAA